ncbi:MAG: hypothetical protein AB7S69_02850 [Salinivirgaceae bacterium]|jgi:hypothetical protein
MLKRLLIKIIELIGLKMTNDNLVWYVGFGSNISENRFLCYIRGGQPEGSYKNYEGCRDKNNPKKVKPITINNELYFAKSSRPWQNGGVGFVKINENNEKKTFAKMYLVTKQQLEDVAKQETDSANYLKIDFNEAIMKGHSIFKSPSWYGNLIYLGREKGYPIFTLTNETNLTTSTKPSREYLQLIIKGLQETHNLTDEEIVRYFIDKNGIHGNYAESEIRELI